MKVKDLIEKLKVMDSNAVVRLHHKDGEPVLFALQCRDFNDVVWLETESDNDMSEEIWSRLDVTAENAEDELDVYTSMLETGIDVTMVRRYIGDEAADHMQVFCKEHGLI